MERTESAISAPGLTHYHAVRFYVDDSSLCRMVAGFIGDGLVAGQPGIIIATPSHRAAISFELTRLSVDIDGHKAAGELLMLDARETLSHFMAKGRPQAVPFRAIIGDVIEGVSRTRTDGVVRAYGEMVDLLWKDGNTVAAIQLEMLWNQLAGSHAFSLLCGYSMGQFYKDGAFQDICRQHTHVIPPETHDVAASTT